MTRERRLLQIKKQLGKITAKGEDWEFYSDEGPTCSVGNGESTSCSICIDKSNQHFCIGAVTGKTCEEAFANAQFVGDAPRTIKYLLGLLKKMEFKALNQRYIRRRN